MDVLPENLDIKLLIADGRGVGEVVAVVEVGLAVVLGGLVEKGACDEDEEVVSADVAGAVIVELLLGEVFGYLSEFFLREEALVVEGFAELGEVDPAGDGGFEEGDVLGLLVGVVAEVGVAGFDEDDRAEAYLRRMEAKKHSQLTIDKLTIQKKTPTENIP